MEKNEIMSKLPYTKPFLFVDEIVAIDENGVKGTFCFDSDLDFYKGHFADFPVTPGVILTETMAQIGVVCLGIYLNNKFNNSASIALTSTDIEFFKPVFPNQVVTVFSEKKYYRFNKLKCRVWMTDESGDEVCAGMIAGIIKQNE